MLSFMLPSSSIFLFSQPLVSNNSETLDRSLQGNSDSTFREVKAQGQTLIINPAAAEDGPINSKPSFSCFVFNVVYFISLIFLVPAPMSYPGNQHLSLISGRPSWPSRCWLEWRPGSSSSLWWWTAWSCLWSAARCLQAGLQQAP